jgi:broad specificity phosphatase PhoE
VPSDQKNEDAIHEEMPESHQCKLILVRHGETEANRLGCFAGSDDIPLTENGRLQAKELAVRLSREFTPQVLVTSTFLRAKQTSQIIADVLGLRAEEVEGLHERDFGCLKGHPYHCLGEMLLRDPHLTLESWRPDGGESLDDVRQRAAKALETLVKRHPGQQIVVVCHGAVIQAICADVTGEWAEATVPPNCGIITIDYVAKTWRLHESVQ